MYQDIFKKLNTLKEDYELNEIFETHSELNPQLFDGLALKSDIRTRLIEIADMFVQSIQEDNIPIKVFDYWLVGSNAQYNYGSKSDIDIHIIVDLETSELIDPYLLKLLYDYIKSDFNKKYTVEVKGHEVELYLEDVRTSAITDGIYSLKKDKWIKEPSKVEIKSFDVTTTDLWKEWFDRYSKLKDSQCEEFLDDLYVMRKISLANDGEWGEGNLVFKEFRNQGYIQALKDRKYKFKSQELTLENLEELFEPVLQTDNTVKGIYKLVGKRKSSASKLKYYYISEDINALKSALQQLNSRSRSVVWSLVCDIYKYDSDDETYDYVDSTDYENYNIDTRSALNDYIRKYHNHMYSSEYASVYRIDKV